MPLPPSASIIAVNTNARRIRIPPLPGPPILTGPARIGYAAMRHHANGRMG
jgi:hypothetical protein